MPGFSTVKYNDLDALEAEFKKDGEGVSGNVGNKLFVEQDKTIDRPLQ